MQNATSMLHMEMKLFDIWMANVPTWVDELFHWLYCETKFADAIF